MSYRIEGGPAKPVVIVGQSLDGQFAIQRNTGASPSSLVLMQRDSLVASSVIEAGTSVAASAIDMRGFVGGYFVSDAQWDAANLGFYVGEDANGSFVVMKDQEGVPIQISGITVGTSFAYTLPDTLFGAHWIKPYSKSTVAATITGVNQADNVWVKLYLKS